MISTTLSRLKGRWHFLNNFNIGRYSHTFICSPLVVLYVKQFHSHMEYLVKTIAERLKNFELEDEYRTFNPIRKFD